MSDSTIKLTQYSHGAGCGCKLAPAVLDRILAVNPNPIHSPNLLVGNHSRDDAAAYDLGDGKALLSTTDFFMPIVDDPYTFGRIAAANSISDVYAMGGKPVLAIAILGWPIDKLPPEVAGQVLDGARSVCAEAGVALGGGHSIDSPEPIFGLAVNGLVEIAHLKRNDGAKVGDRLFLTKSLGVGILSTAEKRGALRDEDRGVAAASMMRLNSVGATLASIDGVHAMTDVTGFGLLGHLGELCRGSDVCARVDADALPLLTDLEHYIEAGVMPGGTRRNWESYGADMGEITGTRRAILCDPQTSGGLLVSVREDAVPVVQAALREAGLEVYASPIGELIERGNEGEPLVECVCASRARAKRVRGPR